MKKEDLQKFYLTYRLYIFPVVVAFSCLVLIILVIYPETVKLIINQKTQEEVLNKHKFLEVKAQTLANFRLAQKNGLKIIGAVNKVDMNPPQLESVIKETAALLKCPLEEILKVFLQSLVKIFLYGTPVQICKEIFYIILFPSWGIVGNVGVFP